MTALMNDYCELLSLEWVIHKAYMSLQVEEKLITSWKGVNAGSCMSYFYEKDSNVDNSSYN